MMYETQSFIKMWIQIMAVLTVKTSIKQWRILWQCLKAISGIFNYFKRTNRRLNPVTMDVAREAKFNLVPKTTKNEAFFFFFFAEFFRLKKNEFPST